MTANEFLEYIHYFSGQNYDKYYTDDILLQLPTMDLVGKQAVKDFYANMNQYIHETIRVRKMFWEGDGLVAHIVSDFYCIKDWPEFHVKPMKKGEIHRSELLVLYKIRDGKFCRIRAGRLKPLEDEYKSQC
jgi:ketosteroid isomerase-like protein